MSLLMSGVSLAGTPLALASTDSIGGAPLADKVRTLLVELSPGLILEEMGESHQALQILLHPVVENADGLADLGLDEEQLGALQEYTSSKGARIPETLLDALFERKTQLRELVKATWDSLTPTPTRSELVAATLRAAVAKSDKTLLTDEEISNILSELGRVNLSRDRGPAGPMPSQIQQFKKGYRRASELLQALNISADMLKEQPHLAYRAAPIVTDLDGTSWDTTYHWGVSLAALKHLINRTALGVLQKSFPFFSLLDTEFTLYTMWRVGWLDYLVGVCYALQAAYPVDTKGWSRRPAALSYQDAAVRTIFLGPDYDIGEPERRAQKAYCADAIEKWNQLEPSRQQQLIIDEIEKDLLAKQSFFSTVHIAEVVTSLLEKFQGGVSRWQQDPWTQDELERLDHVFSRPWKDLLLPTGFTIQVGSKIPAWARAAGKSAVAETLEHRGLLDDKLKHITPLVQQGGRGVHISGGHELLFRAPKVGPIDTLLGTIYVNGRQTEAIINNIEEDFDPEKGGKRVVVPGLSTLRTYEDPRGLLTPLRRDIAAISTKNPTETAPVELNFSDTTMDLKYPVEQFYGYRWEMEEKVVNGLRHNRPQKQFSLKQRLQIGVSSGMGLAMAYSVPHAYTMYQQMSFDQHDVVPFACMMTLGMTTEALAYRTIMGNVIHAYLGSFVMMTGALTALQIVDPQLSLTFGQFGQNIFMGLAFAIMDTTVQRTVIPALLLAFGRRSVVHLQGKNLKKALKAISRGRTSAKSVSFVSAVVFFSILEFLYLNP